MTDLKTKQYSQALYEIAEEEAKVKDYLDLSYALLNVDKETNLFSYLGNWEVSVQDKKELIKDICEDNIFYKNWLYVLIDSHRFKNLKSYINAYINLYNSKHNIVKGYVWTTEFIDIKLIEKLQEKLSKKLDKKITLENKINKEILGGIKLEVEDQVWDNTITNRLKELLNEGSK